MGTRYLLTLLLAGLTFLPARAQLSAGAASDSSRQLRPAVPSSRLRSVRPVVLRAGIPLALIGVSYFGREQKLIHLARLEVREETLENFPAFNTNLDDYTRHLPGVAAYALHAAGVKPARGVVPFSLIYLAAHHLNMGVTSNLKRLCREARPDNPTDLSSFPSAHTSEAFLTATLLHEQFGKASPWISVGGFAVATATGTMRVLHNRHWITDVVAGAGIGFLSAEAVWRAYPYLAQLLPQRAARKLLLVPTYGAGGAVGLVLAVQP
ncbi:phosphatase PAP2 family protein [Hymenobacter persicinus]|uniref:Phosphatase PAP2 family protein n=1 Tax=Hymenobacter persicinus TaxID=2025506 RepID=A0A4V1ZAF7_9BACT|nr:phosphatase PAP2 family protein [Hymenobacter persicinus]RYU77931.1 phosphatase PAP2 family protein [Hymenobacter persicinus]